MEGEHILKRNRNIILANRPTVFVISIEIQIGDWTAKIIQKRQLKRIERTRSKGKVSGFILYLYILTILNRGVIK